MPVLITAGATRNPIDAVRYLSADSTGRTGIALGEALGAVGIEPYLLGSAEARLRAGGLPGEEYGSTHDLMARMERWVRANPAGGVLHASAVGDYEVAEPSDEKVPSGRPTWELVLVPTPRIADHVRAWGLTGPYVTFKAAAPGTPEAEVEALAKAQRKRTGSDLVFANVLGRLSKNILLVGEETRRFSTRTAAIAALGDWMASRLTPD